LLDLATIPVSTIQLVGACYYVAPRKFARRAEAIANVLAEHGYAVELTSVAMAGDPPSNAPSTRFASQWVRSQGQFLDMSAFKTALSHHPGASLHVFFNDTLLLRHPWRLFLRRLSELLPSLAAAPSAAAIGELHPSTDILQVHSSNPSGRHLSTFFFALNPAAVSVFNGILGALPASADPTAIGQWIQRHVQTHPELSNLLHVHLLGPPGRGSWRHRTSPATEGLLLRKAVTVVVEHVLTAEILRRGGFLMPVNADLFYRIVSRASRAMAR
jgi:hypothetical protein